MTSRLQSGLYILQVAIIDDNDYPMGQLTTPNSPVNGTVYSPLLVVGAVSYTTAADTVENAYSFRSQKFGGNRDLGLSALGAGTLELAEYDDVFDPLVMGYARDAATATAEVITGHNANRGKARRLMLAFSPAATPANGLNNFDTIFTWGTLRRGALGSNQATGRNPNNRQYTLTKFLSTRTPWGQLFSASTIAPDGNSDDEVVVYSDAPQEFCTYIDDASATTFAMPYALEYTEHAGARNKFYKNGVENKSSVTSISSATVTRTASSAADKVVAMGPSLALLAA